MMIYPQQPLILCLVLSPLAFVKANWQEWWTYDGISGIVLLLNFFVFLIGAPTMRDFHDFGLT